MVWLETLTGWAYAGVMRGQNLGYPTGGTMAKTKLETPKNRLSLAPGKPHSEPLRKGAHLLYERSETEKGKPRLPGVWKVRVYNPENKKQKLRALESANDFTEATGLRILNYEQARARAEVEAKELEKEFEEGITGGTYVSTKDYTVRQAMEDYLDHLRKNGKKSVKNWTYKINAHIIPTLGDIKVSRLSKDVVDTWKLNLVEKPRRQTFRTTGNRCLVREVNEDFESLTDDKKRKRRGTANHLLEILKSGLNLALDSGKAEAPPKGGWNRSKLYVGTTIEKIMYLKPHERQKLIDSCPTSDFQKLVMAGLITGARFSELARLEVKHIDTEEGNVLFGPFGKVAGKSRRVFLTEEEVAFFKTLIDGKGSNDLIFIRPKNRFQPASTKRNISEKWLPGDHVYYMRKACKTAEINNFTFHGLRHIFASDLVKQGVPLVYVANQLGHSSIKLVQTTYGHLMPDSIAESIRAAKPKIPAFLGVDKLS